MPLHSAAPCRYPTPPRHFGRNFKTAFLAVASVFAAQASAAIYYVATTGSDTNPGSSSRPWRTIQKAADTMVAEDTVIVRNGTYAERVRSRHQASPEAPITFRAESNGTIVGAFAISHSYHTIVGFRISGNQALGFQGSITALSGGNHLTVENCIFAGGQATTHQLLIYHVLPRATHAVIRNNRFEDAKYLGVSLAGSNHLLQGNTFTSDHGCDAVRILSDDTIIRGNTFNKWSNRPREAGDVLCPGLRYSFIALGQNADFSNVGAGPGPYKVGETYSWVATASDPKTWGGARVLNINHADIFQTFSSPTDPDGTARRVIIEGNHVSDAVRCQIGNLEDQSKLGYVSDWTWKNNVFVRVEGIMSIYVPNQRFYNNTFFESGKNSGSPLLFRASTTRNSATGAILYNNMFVRCGSNPASATQGWYGRDGISDLVADNNLVVGIGAGQTKTGFQTGGRETDGLNGVDPLLVDPNGGNFRLSARSPAIGAGRALNHLFTSDHANTPRGAVWDIGAYAFLEPPDGAPTNLTIDPE